ncbi:MAG: hypothetical protein R3359_01510 [Marinirhabdus sp.]|nr:hypothetical protein [Marinirhabdus sp.]
MIRLLALFIGLISVLSCQETGKKSEPAETAQEENVSEKVHTVDKIADKVNISEWDDVKEISFTFNVDRGDSHFERSWKWNPTTNDVTFLGNKDTVSYNRKQMDSTAMQTDQGFVNDSYWLLAPYKLVWDEGTQFTETKEVQAPISKETVDMLTVQYGDNGGYTPGDAYDFYYDDDYVIREWVYRKGGSETPSMVTTFEDYKEVNGIILPTMHKDSTGTFKLYFTNISVNR